MGLLSLIIVLIVMYIFKEKTTLKDKYIKFVLLVVIIEILNPNGKFLSIGSNGIGYKYTLEILLCIFNMYISYKYRIKINNTLFLFSSAFLCSILIGILSEIVCPYDEYIINSTNILSWDGYILGLTNKEIISIDYAWFILLYLKSIISVFSICIIKTIFDKNDILFVLNKTIKYTRFVIYYGFIEYIILNILVLPDIVKYIQLLFLGVYEEVTIRGEFYGLRGVTQEPSWYVISLFILIILRVLINKININTAFYKKYNNIEIGLIMILMVLTGGFSSIWYIFILVLIYIRFTFKMYFFRFLNVKKILLYTIIFISILEGLIYLFLENPNNYFSEKMNTTILVLNYLINNDGIIYATSSASRLISIYDVMNDFLNRPLLGLGLGIETAHSGLVTFLSDFGIIGAYLYFKIILYNNFKNIKYDKWFLFIYFIIANIAMGLRTLGVEIYFIFIIEATALYYKKI